MPFIPRLESLGFSGIAYKIKIPIRISAGPQGWFRKESHPERAKDNGD
jgi:hypothetical protein